MSFARQALLSLVLIICAARCATTPPPAAADVIPAATQQLLDALPHDATVWQRWVSDGAVYVSEGGDVATKQELLEGFGPFPEGITGSIKVETVRLTTHGSVAVHVFDAHETQTIYGQHIEVKYRSTHTWHREAGEWRLIAAQNLVVPRDPAPTPLESALRDYAGVYDLGGQRRYRVEERADVLVGGRDDGELKPLIAVGENVFYDAGSNLGILRIFVRGAGGAVDRMVQRRKFADTTWMKVPEAGASR